MSKNKTLAIAEWQSICKDEIGEKFFSELVEFVHQSGNDKFLGFKNSHTLKARNFVGLIQTKSGFCVEILPKIFNADLKNSQESKSANIDKTTLEKNIINFTNKIFLDCHAESIASPRNDESAHNDYIDNAPQASRAKAVLLNCLKTLKNSPFKQSHFSNVKTQHFPLLEVFILMFLNEVERLIKRGIKSDYIEVSKNRAFLKGKLLFNENLKYNFVHKERFFTSSDEFSQNIAPNRLISATLELLSKQNLSAKTSAKLNQTRFIFSDIPPSKNIAKDISKCVKSRHFKEYEIILQWCEIFLGHKSFTAYSGADKAFALLFDMNKLFESFVAHHLKRTIGADSGYEIKTQSSQKYLISCSKNGEQNVNLFTLKPDILIRKRTTESTHKGDSQADKYDEIFILDTKWKILRASDEKSGISQGDLYQIYAYASKYALSLNTASADSGVDNRLKTILIYPQCEATRDLEKEWNDDKTWYFKASKILESKENKSSEQATLPAQPTQDSDTNLESKNKISLKLVFFPLE